MKKYRLPLVAFLAIVFFAAPAGHAKTAQELDASVDAAIQRFQNELVGGRELMAKARGILVFPSVYKGGIGIGGEYGEGALRIGGKTVDYYSTAAASIGFQLGGQVKSVYLLFMEDGALQAFRQSDGWKAGVDGSVALVTLGANGQIDTTQANQPILGFVIGQKGLMYNLTLEGSKYNLIEKQARTNL